MSQEVMVADQSIGMLIVRWLKTKEGKSGSAHTERIYRAAINDFRMMLMGAHSDLDASREVIRMIAQGWAGKRSPHASIRGDANVGSATYNQRLAILSSFYRFAVNEGRLQDNPIKGMERQSTATSRHAEVLDTQAVAEKLQKIDRSTEQGLRDYALICIALSTGRRAAELAGLRMGHIRRQGDKTTLHFARTKGGKTIDDQLAPKVAEALLLYVRTATHAQPQDLPKDDALWRSESHQNTSKPISTQSIADIFLKRLGVSTVHSTRHTFAKAMNDSGAQITTIQKRLGHTSLAITAKYLQSLPDPVNPHAQQIADIFGIV